MGLQFYRPLACLFIVTSLLDISCIRLSTQNVTNANDGEYTANNTTNYCQVECSLYRNPTPKPLFERHDVPVTTSFIVCNVKNGYNHESVCIIDLWNSANLSWYLESANSTHMVELNLVCPTNRQVVDVRTTNQEEGRALKSKSPAFIFAVYKCVLPWKSLSWFSASVNLTVLNLFSSNYSALHFSTEGVLADGFRTVGTIGIMDVPEANYIAKGFNHFHWDSLAEVSMFNSSLHDDDFGENMTFLCPNLQGFELQYVKLTKPISLFPWQPDAHKLPNDLARSSFFNNRHYGRDLEIAPNIYRRVLTLEFANVRNLTAVNFKGHLHKLSLKGNKIQFIPPTVFAGVEGLKVLDLSTNLITAIPDGLFDKMSMLLELNLGRNLIVELGKNSLRGLSKLQRLNLKENRIRVISTGYFSNLGKLETLNLESNRIEFIEQGSLSGETPRLKFIFLKGNRLRTFPVALFVNLISLDLSNNEITFDNFNETLDSITPSEIVIGNIKSISDSDYLDSKATTKTLINLQNNKVTMLDMDSFSEKQFLTFAVILNYFSFDLSGNRLVCDCKAFSLYEFMKTPIGEVRSPVSGAKLNVRIRTEDFSTWKCSSPSSVKDLAVSSVPNTTFECVTEMPDCPPECDCSLRSVDSSVTVQCSNRKLRSFPAKLPQSKNELVLHLEDNFLEHVENREYLKRVTKLFASRNNISDVSEKVLKKMEKITVLYLDSNKLTTLPEYIKKMTNRRLTHVNIKHNFFECDCNTLWIKYWLRENIAKVIETQNILCSSGGTKGKSIIYVPDNKFVCELLAGEVAAIVLAVTLTIFLVAVVSVYKHRQEVKVLLYAKLQWHPFDKFELDEDETKIYDAFISYCQKDYRFVCNDLRSSLEQNNPPYKLCIHERDFMAGAPIYENIMNSVKLSKRMIMILSNDFLLSEWCMLEFRTAHQKVLKEHSRYLIIIALGDIVSRNTDEDLQAYLKTNTYLTVDDKLFLERLRYALPRPTSQSLTLDSTESASV